MKMVHHKLDVRLKIKRTQQNLKFSINNLGLILYPIITMLIQTITGHIITNYM